MAENDAAGVEITVRIDAPRDVVFDFLTDREKLARWLADSVRATVRPGGELLITASGGEVVSGQFIDIVPMTKVVFTWGWQSRFANIPPGSTTVEITLEPDGDGTLLRLATLRSPARDDREARAGLAPGPAATVQLLSS
jgi:uncharacterized protein YndB with AHSA1/START domain